MPFNYFPAINLINEMKNKFRLFVLLTTMLMTACKTTELATKNPTRIILLRFHDTGNTYSSVMEVTNRSAHLRSARVINDNTFFEHYQQMEIEVDLLNAQQWSLLQTELFRIPG
jgi:hypothetical protein